MPHMWQNEGVSLLKIETKILRLVLYAGGGVRKKCAHSDAHQSATYEVLNVDCLFTRADEHIWFGIMFDYNFASYFGSKHETSDTRIRKPSQRISQQFSYTVNVCASMESLAVVKIIWMVEMSFRGAHRVGVMWCFCQACSRSDSIRWRFTS